MLRSAVVNVVCSRPADHARPDGDDPAHRRDSQQSRAVSATSPRAACVVQRRRGQHHEHERVARVGPHDPGVVAHAVEPARLVREIDARGQAGGCHPVVLAGRQGALDLARPVQREVAQQRGQAGRRDLVAEPGLARGGVLDRPTDDAPGGAGPFEHGVDGPDPEPVEQQVGGEVAGRTTDRSPSQRRLAVPPRRSHGCSSLS